MTRFIFINLWLVLFLSCAPVRREPLTGILSSLEQTGRFRLHIRADRVDMTGILAVRHPEGEWRGSVINEFGIKAFDFIVKDRKCRLLNILPSFNKWYIRKTIESDFSFLFRAAQQGDAVKGKSVSLQSGGAFRIKNERRHIEYIFQPMTDTLQTFPL
ncbi:MAG: hypothetical protein LBP25_03005 [Tannerellaceae bacterium]|jgi:hypothetical protein|nr:hypothetical protein [Tannerellaceae bacterium]